MNTLIIRSIVGILTFMVLDGIWLGLVMKDYYRDRLAPIARLADGSFAPNWAAAFVVYLLLGTGIAFFVASRAPSLAAVAISGALFGLVVYGVYDFTNYSTLRQWPLGLTFADVAWGAFACSVCAMVMWTLVRP